MNKPDNKTIFYIAIGLSAALAIFFLFRANSLQNSLEEAEKENLRLSEGRKADSALHSVDELLIDGKYTSAMKAYNELAANDSQGGEVQWRIALAQQLITLRQQAQKAADTSNKSLTTDTVQVTLTASPTEIRAYDSLLFELQKSKVQVDMLQRKLAEEDDGNYLTFTNRKGNTAHYVGEVKNGKAHGQGIAILNTGSRYVGEWKNNMRHGQGAFFWPDGEFYQGTYKDDIRHGQGTYFWPSGEKFSGQWENDQRNGVGIFYGEDGAIVARGVWKNDELVEVDKEKP